MASTQRAPRRDRDAWWVLVMAGAALVLGASLLGAAIGLFTDRRGMGTVQDLGAALAAWWFLRGSWLRTTWGRPAAGLEAPWAEPELRPRRARLYVWLAGAGVAGAGVALAVQLAGA